MAISNRPTRDELFGALRESLTALVQQTEGMTKFELRVAIQALDILGREMQFGPAAAEDERQRLAGFLGHDAGLIELRSELCERLRNGSVRHDDVGLLELLRAGVEARIAIDNPQFKPT